MKSVLLIGFLVLSTICYICFLLIEGTPALRLQSLAMQRFHAYFTPENRGKPEGQASLLPDPQADFHGNESKSGSDLIQATQQMHHINKEIANESYLKI